MSPVRQRTLVLPPSYNVRRICSSSFHLKTRYRSKHLSVKVMFSSRWTTWLLPSSCTSSSETPIADALNVRPLSSRRVPPLSSLNTFLKSFFLSTDSKWSHGNQYNEQPSWVQEKGKGRTLWLPPRPSFLTETVKGFNSSGTCGEPWRKGRLRSGGGGVR